MSLLPSGTLREDLERVRRSMSGDGFRERGSWGTLVIVALTLSYSHARIWRLVYPVYVAASVLLISAQLLPRPLKTHRRWIRVFLRKARRIPLFCIQALLHNFTAFFTFALFYSSSWVFLPWATKTTLWTAYMSYYITMHWICHSLLVILREAPLSIVVLLPIVLLSCKPYLRAWASFLFTLGFLYCMGMAILISWGIPLSLHPIPIPWAALLRWGKGKGGKRLRTGKAKGGPDLLRSPFLGGGNEQERVKSNLDLSLFEHSESSFEPHSFPSSNEKETLQRRREIMLEMSRMREGGMAEAPPLSLLRYPPVSKALRRAEGWSSDSEKEEGEGGEGNEEEDIKKEVDMEGGEGSEEGDVMEEVEMEDAGLTGGGLRLRRIDKSEGKDYPIPQESDKDDSPNSEMVLRMKNTFSTQITVERDVL